MKRVLDIKASWWNSNIMRVLSVLLRVRICKWSKQGVLEYLSSSTRKILTEQDEMSLLSLKLGSREQSLNNYFDCQLSALLACCSALRGTCANPSELSFCCPSEDTTSPTFKRYLLIDIAFRFTQFELLWESTVRQKVWSPCCT